MKDQTQPKARCITPLAHDSAIKHVTGRATYTDDIAEPAGTLHAYLGCATETHAHIRSDETSRRYAPPPA